MARLNIERQQELEPKRKEVAIIELARRGIDIFYEDDTRIEFMWNGSPIKYYHYSGWHTGKTINDGRGLQNLLKQISF